MAEHIRTTDLTSVRNKKVFFDANIWVYIFCEIADSNKYFVNKYSATFRNLLNSGNQIFIDLAIISEFVNRYLRIAFSNYCKINGSTNFTYKKNYRNTEDFKEAWTTVCDIVNNSILSKTISINFEYDNSNLKSLLNPDTFDTDFNDNHIMNLCRSNDMYLLTHDGDFKNSDINIITENEYYWRS